MIGSNEIEKRFTAQKVTREQANAQGHIRSWAKHQANFIDSHVPDGREKSIALTKLEEFVMWANKGIARGGE